MSERGGNPGENLHFGKRYYEQQIAIPAELARLSPSAQKHVEDLRAERDMYKLESRTDLLTQLPNRKALAEWVDPVIESRLRQRVGGEHRKPAPGSLFVGVIDLDHFKLINDGPGHEVGDKVLQWLAEQMRSAVSDRDIVARVGGEEFVIGLNGVDRATAQERLEALRAQIEQASQPMLAQWGITDRAALTASIGLAEFDGTCESYADVFSRADAAMYTAKQDRNKLVVFDRQDEEMVEDVRDIEPSSIIEAA